MLLQKYENEKLANVGLFKGLVIFPMRCKLMGNGVLEGNVYDFTRSTIFSSALLLSDSAFSVHSISTYFTLL
jgi:hypothetical protein